MFNDPIILSVLSPSRVSSRRMNDYSENTLTIFMRLVEAPGKLPFSETYPFRTGPEGRSVPALSKTACQGQVLHLLHRRYFPWSSR